MYHHFSQRPGASLSIRSMFLSSAMRPLRSYIFCAFTGIVAHSFLILLLILFC